MVTRDATLRIELREQTERARDHYLSLFSSFPNLVWRSDAAGECDYLNQAWLDYTGLAMDEQRGKRMAGRGARRRSRDSGTKTSTRALPDKQPFELEFRLRRADGKYGSMICSARPYNDMQGQLRRLPVLVLRQHRDGERPKKRSRKARSATSA